jgi:Cys-rich repeat protein
MKYVTACICFSFLWFFCSCDEVITCPDGSIPGKCGLTGKCVQCITDADCTQGEKCMEDGTCQLVEPCGPDSPCPTEPIRMVCGDDGLCHQGCPCPVGTACSLINRTWYCHNERCYPEGGCPKGWKKVQGSLACRMTGCPEYKVPGECGLEGYCVSCVDDEDCEEDQYCNRLSQGCYYKHYPYSGCASDMDCPIGMVCRLGMCLIPCWSDMDCGYRKVCINEMCEFI